MNKDEASFLKPGMRVAVPFGKSKVYTGIVYKVHNQPPVGYETKSIDHILDEKPILTDLQLKHWEWLANYYMCSLGEVIKAALPGAFLLESETIIKLSERNFQSEESLSDDEFVLYEALQHQSSLHINDARSILDRKNIVSVIQKLLDKNIIEVEETVYEQYTPKLKRYIKLASEYTSEENLRTLLDSLNRAPKQRDVLMHLFMLNTQTKKPISSTMLQKKSDSSAATLKLLIDKGILEEYFIQQDRVEFSGESSSEIKTLNEAQAVAFQENSKGYRRSSRPPN